MPIHFRTYRNETCFGEDYDKLRDFLVKPDGCDYSFGHWDWMVTHSYLQRDGLSKIGIWEDGGEVVAPVAADPAYRKTGLGRAAVLEAVRRCGELGAARAYAGSSQQLYDRIGFRPFATSTAWAQK